MKSLNSVSNFFPCGWQERLHVILFSSFLFFLAIKGGDGVGVELFDSVEFPVFLLLLKDVSLYAVSALIVFQVVFFQRFQFGYFSLFARMWLVLLFLYYFRLSVDAPDMFLKLLLSFFVFIWAASYINSLGYINKYTRDYLVRFVMLSFFLFFFVYSLMSAYLLYSGYGVLFHSGRFVGFTDHPNFVGMHASLAVVFFLFELSEKNSIKKIMAWIGFFCGAYILIGSASRTAFVSAAIGFSVFILSGFFCGKKTFSSFVYILAVLLFFSVVVLADLWAVIGLDVAVDRLMYSDNTRSEVWGALVEQMLENPFFGVGNSVVASESSLFRFAASSGIFVGLFFQFITIFIVFSAFQSVFGGYYYWLIFSMLLQIVVCSYAEGYLAEFLGLMPILFVVLLSFVKPVSYSRSTL